MTRYFLVYYRLPGCLPDDTAPCAGVADLRNYLASVRDEVRDTHEYDGTYERRYEKTQSVAEILRYGGGWYHQRRNSGAGWFVSEVDKDVYEEWSGE